MISIPQPFGGSRNRGNCAYSLEERQVLNEFKIEYKMQTSRPLRAIIFRSKILPAIYNYWTDNGMVQEPEENSRLRIKVLAVFSPFLTKI
jgi:hypothetical protein